MARLKLSEMHSVRLSLTLKGERHSEVLDRKIILKWI
jgi:hypothetical protein